MIPGSLPNETIQKEWAIKIVELINSTKEKQEAVLFLDPTHQIHNVNNDRQWQEKGLQGTKIFSSNTGRKRLSIVGAINPINLKPSVIITESNCDKELLKIFLSQIRQEYLSEKKIYVILDNASYNRSYEVQDKAKELNIELIYLPPYCPNLNLIERLWKFFKKKITKNRYYQTFLEFYETIIDFFYDFEKFIPELKSLLTLNFEIIKAK